MKRLLLLGCLVFLSGLISERAALGVEMGRITKDIVEKIETDAAYPLTVRELAKKWGRVFGVNPSWVISHAFVESRNMPFAYNKRGHVFGLMQLKPATAADIVRWLKMSRVGKKPEVVETLKDWTGEGDCLRNPDLNMMLGTFYLAFLKRKFGNDQMKVAAAYNQGQGAMERALKAGALTEPMKEYIGLIENAKAQGFA